MTGSLWVCTFFSWRSRRVTGVWRTGLGAGGAVFVRFDAATLALLCFPRGVRWGCAPQTCAKESSTLWTLFTLRRGCLGACSRVCPRAWLALRSCRGFAPRASGIAFLSRLRPRFAPGIAFLSRRFSSVYACCLPCDKQDGLRYLAFLFRRVEIAIRAFSICQCGYLTLWVHFGFGRFFMAISTELPGTRGTELRGGWGWRRGLCAFCAATLALQCFPPGVRWGCAPQTAPKSLRLSGLSSRCGGVMLVRIRVIVTRAHG